MPPPSLASLASPVARPSGAPPPAPSSLRAAPPSAPAAPPPQLSLRMAPPPAGLPTPPTCERRIAAAARCDRRVRQGGPPPTPPVPPVAAAVPSRPPPLRARVRFRRRRFRGPPPAASALNAYGGDAEDDAPTRLYSHGSTPPPAPSRTLPRNERPLPPAPSVPEFAGYGRAEPRKKLYIVGGVLGALVAAAALLLGNRTGALTVTVSGPGGRAIPGVQVFVDGVKRCDASPCRVDELANGAHLVRASAKGYQDTADQAVSVEAGQQGTQNISLSPAGARHRRARLGARLRPQAVRRRPRAR